MYLYLYKYKMKLTIENTTRRGNGLYIKRTKICVAEVEWLCVTIKNFDTDELHWCNNNKKKDIQKYIINEVRKDKKLYNRYKML